MSGGISMDLFGTRTNYESATSELPGFSMIYYGMDKVSNNQINPTGMAWMPPQDDTYVLGNVAFVKKNGKVTDEEYKKIFNKKWDNEPFNDDDGGFIRPAPIVPPICCSIL